MSSVEPAATAILDSSAAMAWQVAPLADIVLQVDTTCSLLRGQAGAGGAGKAKGGRGQGAGERRAVGLEPPAGEPEAQPASALLPASTAAPQPPQRCAEPTWPAAPHTRT